MPTGETKQRLFGIRIYPDSGPPMMVALLATSVSEAEKRAREKTGLVAAPATVRECGEGEHVLVTFR